MGRHNGRDARSYTPLTDLEPRLADAILDIFDSEGIAAYVTPAAASRTVTARSGQTLDRVFVDARALLRAREVLRRRLPPLQAAVEAEAARPNPNSGSGNGAGALLVEEDAWASIVASYAMPTEGITGRWHSSEDVTGDTESRGGRLLRGAQPPAGPGNGSIGATPPKVSPVPEWAWDEGADRAEPGMYDDHYEPPEPPPLPAADFATKFGWICLLGGPMLLLLATLLGWNWGGWLGLVGATAFVSGFVILVMRMRDRDPLDDPDDGAVV